MRGEGGGACVARTAASQRLTFAADGSGPGTGGGTSAHSEARVAAAADADCCLTSERGCRRPNGGYSEATVLFGPCSKFD